MSIGKSIREKVRAGRSGEIYKGEKEAEQFKKNVVNIINLDKKRQKQQEIQQQEAKVDHPIIRGLKQYGKKAVKNCMR